MIERGVCWSTTVEPTINDKKSEDGTGAGDFTSSISGLEANTTYYVRAYATNSEGTSYGSVMSFTTEKAIDYGVYTDTRDGTVYQTVKIGNQVWMAENLAYLPDVLGSYGFKRAGENRQPGYGVYGYIGDIVATAKVQTNYATYGVLYNWYAVNTANFCPAGWHVPSDAEWTELENYLADSGYNYDGTKGGGRAKIAKSLASRSGWTSTWNTGGVGNADYPEYRNKSGFSALPGGFRDFNGSFDNISGVGYWWTATETSASTAEGRGMVYGYSYVSRGSSVKESGFSVRCVRD